MLTRSGELVSLLRRMAGKDEAAFDQLYFATKRKLFITALPIVRRSHLAEEVVQDAYVRIWQNASLYKRSMGSPMNWMIAIARHLAIDTARKPVREIQSDDCVLFGFPTSDPTALEAIEILEDQEKAFDQRLSVLYALQTLDPKRRHLIIAAYISGESRKQLSKRYGVPVNTIKTWIRRALIETRTSIQKPSEMTRAAAKQPSQNREMPFHRMLLNGDFAGGSSENLTAIFGMPCDD